MRILITGVCGFVGSSLARQWIETTSGNEIIGVDNLSRPGTHQNVAPLKRLGVHLFHGDIRCQSDLESLPAVDCVIDAAANPSVLAGLDTKTSSRQLIEHNLAGTVNLLEYCKKHSASFTLLSTSRVYSTKPLCEMPYSVVDEAYTPDLSKVSRVPGLSEKGVSEGYSNQAPLSLYGASKFASEAIALEYGEAFDFPVWINRCGVLAGAGQLGKADQGIFAFWIHSWREKRGLKYIGFDGQGHQVRDSLHPRDIFGLLQQQLAYSGTDKPRIVNLAGGVDSARSLAQLSRWCAKRFAPQSVTSQAENRPCDVPWMVLDARLAKEAWGWEPVTSPESIWEEIAEFALANPQWISLTS